MNRSRDTLIVLFFFLLIPAPAVAQQSLQIPKGRPVLLDGTIGGDWNDASVTELGAMATLYAKQSDEFVWLGLKLKGEDGAVDLYLSPADGSIYDLHSSAKLGERKYQNRWPDWTWWNNQDWVANVSRVDSFEKRTFLPTKVREFQIRKSRFAGPEWKMMIEVLTPAEPEWKVTPYPTGCSNTNTKGWLALRLDDGK